jgi:plasmid stability protein
MATLTIRNVRPGVVKSLKSLARKNRRSMEQQVRELLEEYVADRGSILEQIEATWVTQSRRPTAKQVDPWIRTGRESR